MPNTYQIGRIGRVYAALEGAAYGTAAVLVAGDAVRHLDIKMNQSARNRVNSPERHAHPSQIYRFTRRKTADWMLRGILYPSGTLNTLPDNSLMLESFFGSKTNVTLATTIAVGGAGTTTADTLTSAAGLAVGDAIAITHQDGNIYLVVLQTLPGGGVATWLPALPSALTDGQAVKGCITYKFATAIPATSSLNIAHYLTSKSYEIKGGVPESFSISVDANDEVMWEMSGPAKERVRNAQTDPATFTAVGTAPPSGLTGYLQVNATREEFLSASYEMKNGFEVDNVAFGTTAAQAYYRARKREVTCKFDTMDSNDITIEDLGDSNADATAMVQVGFTSGSIIGIWTPTLELSEPDLSDAEETRRHSYSGIAKGSSGNDELTLIFA